MDRSRKFIIILSIMIAALMVSCQRHGSAWGGSVAEEDADGYQYVKRYRVTWTI